MFEKLFNKCIKNKYGKNWQCLLTYSDIWLGYLQKSIKTRNPNINVQKHTNVEPGIAWKRFVKTKRTECNMNTDNTFYTSNSINLRQLTRGASNPYLSLSIFRVMSWCKTVYSIVRAPRWAPNFERWNITDSGLGLSGWAGGLN